MSMALVLLTFGLVKMAGTICSMVTCFATPFVTKRAFVQAMICTPIVWKLSSE